MVYFDIRLSPQISQFSLQIHVAASLEGALICRVFDLINVFNSVSTPSHFQRHVYEYTTKLQHKWFIIFNMWSMYTCAAVDILPCPIVCTHELHEILQCTGGQQKFWPPLPLDHQWLYNIHLANSLNVQTYKML